MTEEADKQEKQQAADPVSKTTDMPPNEADGAAMEAKMEEQPLNDDQLKVKFTGAANDTKVEIEGEETPTFKALTKAELQKYANDPFWVRLRYFLFILFWIIWVAMLVAAVAIIVVAPKCPTPAPKQWWQKGPIYEVYVKSFKDSDGSGKGDLKGIESKLDHFVDLGVGAVWLSPVYKSPMKDNGYDVTDFTAIDPTFGTMEDFKALVAAMKERGLKLIMDFIPNHSSDQHEWFKKSVKKEGKYADYYIWRDGNRNQPPSNWISVFGGSAWKWNEERQQWYLHQFYESQPDLNLRNQDVVNDLKDVMKFWLDLGVDGFRIDGVAHFFENDQYQDEPRASNSARASDYAYLDHKFTYNQPEVLDLLTEFREVLDAKSDEDYYNPRIMMTEAYLPLDELIKYYGTNITDNVGTISHMPLNFGLITDFKTPSQVSSYNVGSSIKAYLDGLPDGAWPNFNLGNHDNPRASTRFGAKLIDAMNMITMLLPGTPITYYGEEIGMADGNLSGKDPRDPERTPMPWDDSTNAGFTSGQPWLPVNADFATKNVKAQKEADKSHYQVWKNLAALRHNDAILFGSTDFVTNGTVFAYSRVKKGNPGYMVAVNFGDEVVETSLTGFPNLPKAGTVYVRSVFDGEEKTDEEEKSVEFSSVSLSPKEGMVITFVPKME